MRRALYVLLLAACDQPAPPPLATPTAAEDRYGVYAEALRYLYAASSDGRLIVAGKTARHLGLADTNELRQRMKDFAADSIHEETWQAFLTANTTDHPIIAAFPSTVSNVLVDSVRWREPRIKGQGVLLDFPEAEGLISLSEPGFDPGRTEALVATFLGCGPLCGRGGLLYLRRTNGHWQVHRKLLATAS